MVVVAHSLAVLSHRALAKVVSLFGTPLSQGTGVEFQSLS
jgi:hypothetical protein